MENKEPLTTGRNYGAISLLLSLFLLLLIFFVVLDSMATISSTKSKAVRASLDQTFSTADSSGDWPMWPNPPSPGAAFLDQAKDVIETAIPAAKIKLLKPGNLMQATFDAESLFFPGRVDLRPAQGALLDRLVAALSVHPDGEHHEMEILIGTPPADGSSDRMPTQQTLEVARVGTIGRELIGRGIPPDAFLVGLSHGNPTEVQIRFHILDQKSQ